MLLSHKMKVKVLLLPDGHDPDSFARVNTPEKFREYVKAVESMPEGEAIMALTRYVDDESPLYARLNDAGDEVIDYRYGASHSGRADSVGRYIRNKR